MQPHSSVAHFRCPQTSIFIFDKHKLTLTLEEYSIAIGNPLKSELISPPIGIESISTLSNFMRIKEDKVRNFLKSNRNDCLFSFLECLKNSTSFQISRIFLLAFFGFVIFLHCKNSISPSIAWIVQQVCAGRNFFNAILVEIPFPHSI